MNAPLQTKLVSVVLLSMILLISTALYGAQRLRRQYEILLFNSYQNILGVSVSTFTDVLDSTTDYLKTITTDNDIQSGLASIKDETRLSLAVVKNLEMRMQSFVNDDLNQNIYGMTAVTERGNFYNSSYKYDNGYDAALGTQLSAEDLRRIMEILPEAKPVWITDYSDTFGLVIAQNVRRISPMRLDSLGVIVCCMDLEAAIHDCTSQLQQEACYFSLSDGSGRIFYIYDNTGEEVDFPGHLESDKNYVVFKQNDNWYFMIKGSITGYGWDYYYAIPYDSIMTSVHAGFRNLVVTLIFCVMVALGASWLWFHHIMKDFDKLMDMIHNLGAADFESVRENHHEKRNDEIGILMQQFIVMSDKIDLLIQEQYEGILLAQEARLRALEMQINPHFLYNTLESVRCCARLGQNDDVCRIVESLGKIMHSIMSDHNRQLNLQSEMNLIDDYILIQKIRFGERIVFIKQIDEACKQAVLPKLVILPLVENAVVHGVESSSNVCYISADVWKEEDLIHIRIKNTGSGFVDHFFEKLQNKEITPTRHGIGLLNVDSRLKMFFKKDYQIEFYNEDDLAVVDVTIPYWLERKIESGGDKC